VSNVSTSRKQAWLKFDVAGKKTFTYQRDVNLRIESAKDNNREDLSFDWNHYPQKKVSEETYLVYYNNSIIKEVVMLFLDGGNVVIPYPKITDDLDNLFDDIDIKIASIIDRYDNISTNIEKVKGWIKKYYTEHPLEGDLSGNEISENQDTSILDVL